MDYHVKNSSSKRQHAVRCLGILELNDTECTWTRTAKISQINLPSTSRIAWQCLCIRIHASRFFSQLLYSNDGSIAELPSLLLHSSALSRILSLLCEWGIKNCKHCKLLQIDHARFPLGTLNQNMKLYEALLSFNPPAWLSKLWWDPSLEFNSL